MRIPSRKSLLFVAFMILGLFTAWETCVAQGAHTDMIGGQCYSCAHDECDWHDVPCEAQSGKTCSKNMSCCRGPNTGDGFCTVLRDSHGHVLQQCDYTGCQTRRDEICTE